MKVKKIDHIGIAVRSVDEALQLYRDILGLEVAGCEEVPEQKARVAFLPMGDSQIELLESTSADGPLAKFLTSRGEGIHHLALRVENLEETLKDMEEKGVRLLDRTPRGGAGHARIAFAHPKDTHGVLLELCERPQLPSTPRGETRAGAGS